MKLGAQLYTVHGFTKDLEGLENSLKKIAEIGYKYVQVSGTCDYEPEWLDETLKKYGLKCIITHTNQEKMIEDPQTVVENHNKFDCKYIGLGSMPNLYKFEISDQQIADDLLEKYKEVMKVFKQNGKLLMYHNHQFEFTKLENGQHMFDYIIENTAADELGFTLDTYWVKYAGMDLIKLINKLKGRVPCVHFKDMSIFRGKENQVRMAPVGYGNFDWDEIIEAFENAGTEYAFVEQDNCYDDDPFDCLKKSFDFLVSKGLEVE